jgi:hypothetical protein
MKDIANTRKMENGVALYYQEGSDKKVESFTYSELIDMQINALDLLTDSRNYAIDVAAHKVVMKK